MNVQLVVLPRTLSKAGPQDYIKNAGAILDPLPCQFLIVL